MFCFAINIYWWKHIAGQILEYEWEWAVETKMLNCLNEFLSDVLTEKEVRRGGDFL